ncbi:hypothetical protein [Candidatus Nitrospira salsa]
MPESVSLIAVSIHGTKRRTEITQDLDFVFEQALIDARTMISELRSLNFQGNALIVALNGSFG